MTIRLKPFASCCFSLHGWSPGSAVLGSLDISLHIHSQMSTTSLCTEPVTIRYFSFRYSPSVRQIKEISGYLVIRDNTVRLCFHLYPPPATVRLKIHGDFGYHVRKTAHFAMDRRPFCHMSMPLVAEDM